jgi:hypothetical protein
VSLASRLFPLDPHIRYVAENRGGTIVEMTQRPERPTLNPHETDRIEELIVNPVLLELVRRRGRLDLDGMRWVLIRYGTLYELVLPTDEGHVSVGIDLDADVAEVVQRVLERSSPAAPDPPPR